MAIRQVTRAGVGLVIGIIILAALVFGALWFVRERGEQAQREEAITIAEEQLEAESDGEVAIETDENKNEDQEGSETIPSTGNNSTQPSATDELPQTGPELHTALGVGFVSFAVASYIRSRKLGSNEL